LLDHRVFVGNGYSERCRLYTSDQRNIESAPIEHPKRWFTVAALRFIWHRDKKGNIEGFREAMVFSLRRRGGFAGLHAFVIELFFCCKPTSSST
jgi:hypothetical protein